MAVDKFFGIGAPGGIIRRYAPHPFGVALKGDRRHYVASSNPIFLCRGFDRVANRDPMAVDKFFGIGAPGGIRTHDPRLRRPILYPAELRAQRWGGDTTRRRQGPSSTRSTKALTRAYVVSFEAACSLRTVAQFRVVTVAPALRENA